jgi:hypothetical protein
MMPGVGILSCNPRISKTDRRVLRDQGQPGLHRETLSQKGERGGKRRGGEGEKKMM